MAVVVEMMTPAISSIVNQHLYKDSSFWIMCAPPVSIEKYRPLLQTIEYYDI